MCNLVADGRLGGCGTLVCIGIGWGVGGSHGSVLEDMMVRDLRCLDCTSRIA
jgi:hypothetical protein